MKLIEVLQPLLENKVDHITRNQWLKIFVSAYTDGSLNTNVSGTDLALGGLRPVYLVDILKSSGERDVSITSYSLKRMTVDHIRDYDSRRIRKSVGELQYVISNNLKRVTSLTLEDTIRKYAYQVVQFMADNISKKHLQWVVNRYIEDDFRLMEDYEMVQNTLEVYDKVRLETDIPQLTKGISYQYLFHEIVKFIDAEEQELRDVREKRLVADGELEIPFYQDKSEYVAIPKTFKASKHLSKPNGWCTQHENWFDTYTKDGVLYFFRHRGKPYLVHFESRQFMGKANQPFDVGSMIESSPAFQWIINQRKKEVENMQTGNPSAVAHFMVRNGYTNDTEWAMKVIENDKTGDPSQYAYEMVRYGHAPVEWAMKVIENAKTGDPSQYAYRMVRDGFTNDTEWAMKVIENATTGNPSYFAYMMVRDGHAPQEWYYDRNFG